MLTGSIPETLWNVTTLESLLLFQNMLSGTISSAIRAMNRLTEL